MKMGFGRLASFSCSSKCCLWYWIVLLSFVDGGSCMWTPRTEQYIATSVGQTADNVWGMEGPPTSENYCPLLTLGTYPYLVKIYANTPDVSIQIRTGSLLSHRAVLTVCHGFTHVSLRSLQITAGRVFRRKGLRNDYCFQKRKVINKHRHPKCQEMASSFQTADKFWDYQILELNEMFYAEKDFAYPVLPILKQPYDMVQFIRCVVDNCCLAVLSEGCSKPCLGPESGEYERTFILKAFAKVSILRPDVEGCELPMFVHPEWNYPVFAYTAKVDTQMHGNVCPTAICDPHFTDPEICKDILRGYLNQTFLCVQPKFLWKVDLEVIPTWLGGPLVCNNTAVGLNTANIVRVDSTNDWYLIATFLRTWPWVMSMKQRFWNKWYNREGLWDSPFLEHHLWRWHKFTTEKHDKNINKEPGKRFKFVKKKVYSEKVMRKSSSDKLRVTYILYGCLALTTVILV